jgi:1-aminocyclopropane-1-carboxylate deaminase/D-cysteine desulfhydrase-like pyridoxal-dependent ACC family enzyme
MKICTELTPVVKHNGSLIYYKRDDLYTPYGKEHINGGKTRQAIQLFSEIYSSDILPNHNNGVVTASSVHSPQSAIIAKVASDFGADCIVAIGGSSEETMDSHHMIRLCKYYGADVVNVAGHGMTSAIDALAKRKIISENNYMLIKFAIAMDNNPEAIFSGVIDQVANIPDELDVLVVPVGSGIQFAGILVGLEKYGKKVGRVIGVGFCDRRKNIDGYLNQFKYGDVLFGDGEVKEFSDYEMILTDYDYNKSIWEKCMADDSMLDDIYEGKAHLWMRENIDISKEKTLFWCVGRRLNVDEVDSLINK